MSFRPDPDGFCLNPNCGEREAYCRCRSSNGSTTTAARVLTVAPAPAPPVVVTAGPRVVRVSDVAAERVTWIWPGYLPAGKLVVVDGDPGVGKSTLTLDIAARVSTGSPMPDGAACARPGPVLLLSAEDGIADTIRPRLDAAGADPARVHVLTEWVGDDGRPRPVDIVSDLHGIADVVRHLGVVMVVVDPFMAYVGTGVDSHRDQDIRRALHPIAELAADTAATFVIVRHMNKTTGGSALYRGGGSIGIIGAARMGYLVAADPDPDGGGRRVLAPTKCNIAPMPPALAYRTVSDELRGVARIEWDGATEHRADDLLRPALDDDQRHERDDAADWLRDHLEQRGTVPAADVKKAAKREGIAERTLHRARSSLHVTVERVGFPSTTVWSLPQSCHETASHDSRATRAEPGMTGTTVTTGAPVARLADRRPGHDPSGAGVAVTDGDWPPGGVA